MPGTHDLSLPAFRDTGDPSRLYMTQVAVTTWLEGIGEALVRLTYDDDIRLARRVSSALGNAAALLNDRFGFTDEAVDTDIPDMFRQEETSVSHVLTLATHMSMAFIQDMRAGDRITPLWTGQLLYTADALARVYGERFHAPDGLDLVLGEPAELTPTEM